MSASTPDDDFAGFVANRSPHLLRTAWLLTGDAGRAEDLLQTALAVVWPKWRRIVAGGHPEAYVRRVLVTKFLSWQRRHWRFEVPTEAPPDPTAPGELAGRTADRDAIRRALAGLSRQQRAVVVLRYVEDLSVAETASLLGCSPATVRVQAGRALAALRLDPHVAEEGVR
ncbi:SigE family RNA polymerase sigma factor [Virgisporangium aurantiacum]|uniref:RNA polymerase n=1 Tax=Virgisporangium aurantiacum TaxID=175570 RepID=A0A8J4E0K8_9ACTN|nr:SigE family RNA polymerase sigma factor [Virgisporangium aurantiacum]GIJ57820.1 RNA polymerase [Virgisporangium aurantiacum]